MNYFSGVSLASLAISYLISTLATFLFIALAFVKYQNIFLLIQTHSCIILVNFISHYSERILRRHSN